MSSDANLVAMRYVRALFEMAEKNKQHDSVKEDLLALKSVLSKSPELQKFLVNPIVSRKQSEKSINTVLTALKVSSLTHVFFTLLAKRRRLAITPQIIDRYLAQLAQARGELLVHVVSASALAKPQIQLLSDVIADVTRKKVELKLSENSQLIGGVQIQIGNKMFDNSVSGKLSRLRMALSKAA